MTENYLELKIQDIDGGNAVERLNFNLQRAIENTLDPNASPTAKRVVSLIITIRPNIDRSAADLSYQALVKLPPDTQGVDRLYLTNGAGGPRAFVSGVRQIAIEDFLAEQEAEDKPIRMADWNEAAER